MNKRKVFNFGGLLLVVASAVCASLLISLDNASANGETISALEIFRAAVSGLIAMTGFFTRRELRVGDGDGNGASR